MKLFLGAVPIILRLFSKAKRHLLFSNYSRNNLPKPSQQTGQPQSLRLHPATQMSLNVRSLTMDLIPHTSEVCVENDRQ